MYKLLLCWRYLRTRYIALVCIISVMLGVATMIVVNSVMAGFTHEMQVRLNGMLGDLVLEARSMDGAPDADAAMARIKEIVGDDVAGMSPTVVVPALMYIDVGGQSVTRQITLVGIEQDTYASVSAFGQYLQHPANRKQLDFTLRADGYDVYDHQAENIAKTKPREPMRDAGWRYRRYKAMIAKQRRAEAAAAAAKSEATKSTATAGDDTKRTEIADPFQAAVDDAPQGHEFDPAVEQHIGVVVGMGVCSWRDSSATDQFIALPGDDVKVAFTKATMPPDVIGQLYTIVDFYESKMNEYDSNFVFVPLRKLQEDRGMIDPTTGVANFSSIQIKLVPGADADALRDKLQDAFPVQQYAVSTWRDKQGALLAAVQMETAVLNVLLFMIIAVAGFGILAIFFMIVVEKTRDIGILKSLGASAWGIMGIFLGYGVSLGMLGAFVGVAIGLAFVRHINEIADFVGWLTGQPVFDPAVYYFYEIPTIVRPFTVTWIALGAILIAVLASVLPAFRAARLHPVRALRYE